MSAQAFGMIWPLASEYARRGWAVRRADWDDPNVWGYSGRSLRWIYYHNALFWLIYRDASTGEAKSKVVTAPDFGVEEFMANNWTVLTPDCYAASSGVSTGFQQGKSPYPEGPEGSIPFDPVYPNSIYGSCPVVPLYTDITTT